MYHEKFKHLPVAFAPSRLTNTLAETISRENRTQFHCAESEKFAHVTFFLNGGNNHPFPGEVDLRIPSPKGIPFENVPELSLEEVCQEVISAIQKDYDFIVTNFANGDVIGHTSSTEAKMKCAEFVDSALEKVVKCCSRKEICSPDYGRPWQPGRIIHQRWKTACFSYHQPGTIFRSGCYRTPTLFQLEAWQIGGYCSDHSSVDEYQKTG